ncbi:PAS domain-containing protein [Streptomyces sp. NBC_00258]|uniref:PAS domain-containing protein n=1 Tax=Streptomyces sp. NBC_00258 TaxID=2903642 RepID=UPI002E2C785C|nr:PAS domain-containing protein [Streptomyces sp. NBC_00258]
MTDDGPRDLYEAMMLAAPDGIVAVDADGCVRACNPAAAALLERPADELIGSVFGFPLVHGEATEVTLVLPNGRSKVVEMRVTLARLDGRHLYVAALRDGTRRRQADHVSSPPSNTRAWSSRWPRTNCTTRSPPWAPWCTY